jgi:hypothetical protein
MIHEVRNLNTLYSPSPTHPWRLVVTDRFYTSVKLALGILHRRIYLTGTISTDRSGYAKDLVTSKSYKTVKKKKIPLPPQGTIKIAESKRFPQITAALWMYRNPVHLLSSGVSRQTGALSKYIMREHLQETVANSDDVVVCVAVRRVDGEMQAVPAPELIRDYHRWMGGVDVHDQP